MASSGQTESGSGAVEGSAPQDITNVPRRASGEQQPPASTPLEMSNLESRSENAPTTSTAESSPSPKDSNPGTQPTTTADKAATSSQDALAPSAALEQTISTAIGPSSDQPVPVAKDSETAGPTLVMTLLLTSGARHPFKLDSKYLSKRNVKVADNNPFNLSVYTLKELILREWRDEWEQKPTSPSSIRLISFGKLLDDKSPLKDSKFSPDSPNVVHMTVKPQEIVDEEDAKGSKGAFSTREREGSERSPGCRCVIL